MIWKMWLFLAAGLLRRLENILSNCLEQGTSFTQAPVTKQNLTRSECVWDGTDGGMVTTLQPGCVDWGIPCQSVPWTQ